MPVTVNHSTLADGTFSASGALAWDANHTLTGLGTMAEQNANNVAITGGTISGVTLPASNITGTLGVPNGGTGASTLTGYVKGNGTATMTAASTIPNTDVTGLGTMSTQNANAVAITGGTISGTTITGYIPTTEKGVALGVATLDAGGKVPQSQIPLMGDLNYQGTWNASTNTPTLTSSVGTKGYYYVVDVAGSTNLNGITDWQIGDWAIFNGTIWQKVDNTDAVTSVNGATGTVVLTTTNIAEGTNLYYTDARARAAISAGTGISYDNATGVVTNAAPDQTVALTDGTAIDVTGTYPNFTINNTAPDQTVVLTAGTGISTSGTYPNFTIANTAPSLGGDVVGPASATDNAIARFDTTTGKLIQNSVVTVSDTGVVDGVTHMNNVDYIDFDTTYATTLGAGQLGWNGNDTLGLGMIGGNVIQHIGEDQFFYIKASATITKGQVVMFTGAVGASGVPLGAPATGITNGNYIMGVAAEAIANNGFGLVQTFGVLRNVNTSGYADGDILWYNPAVTGGLTKTEPVAPNVKAQIAAVINGGSSGGGTILIRINAGSTLGGTDSNAQITTPSNGQIITYDGQDGYWRNTDLTAGTAISVSETATGVLTIANTGVTQATAGTGISVSAGTGNVTITNTAPDQVVALTQGGATTITGTYPNFTISSVNTTYSPATSTVAGLIELGSDTVQTTAANAITTTASRSYALQVNSAGQGVMNVPWTDSGGTVTSVGGTGTVNGITLTGTVTSTGNLTLGGTLSNVSLSTQVTGTLPIANGGSGATTAQTAMNAFAGAVTSGSYLRGNGTNVVMATIQAGDVPTLNQNTTGTASNVTGTVAIINGGTGQTTQQAAINALTGTQTSGTYLRSNGTNASLSTIQAADVPTLNQNTTGSAATLTTGRTIAITGDLAYTSPSFNGSTNVTAAGTLATVNANVGSFTNASVTVNAKGLVTAVSSGTAPVTSVTGTSPVVSSGGATPAISMPAATTTVSGYLTSTDWNTFNSKGSGTVTAVSVTSANGFAGTSSGGANPALTLSTSITGLLKGNGTAISAATAGTDYSAGTSALGTGILKSTTTTGALTIAVAADFPTLNQNTTGTAANVTGTVAIANGGTGATTAPNARTNLGATTLGANIFTITNPSAITFPRFNANNTISSLTATDFRTAIGAGTGSGTVTSVGGTGTVSGLTLTGTVTTTGNLTLGGTLNLSSPPAIGGTTPNAITGTTITATNYVGVGGGNF